MAFEQSSSKPGLQGMTSGQISSGLDLTYAPSTITTQQPTEGELDLLFEAMYDDHIGGQPSAALRTVPAAQVPQLLHTPMATITTADTTPTPTKMILAIVSPSEPLPSTSHPLVISATTASLPTPVAEPTSHPKFLSPEPDNEPIEHTFEQPSPEHQSLSPRQETEVPQSQDPTHPHVPEARTIKVEDLLHLVPKLITKVDSLETELKQTKLTMGKAIV
ncbi:hypothetical protein Tco_0264372 [Tanacetum coccineum]